MFSTGSLVDSTQPRKIMNVLERKWIEINQTEIQKEKMKKIKITGLWGRK